MSRRNLIVAAALFAITLGTLLVVGLMPVSESLKNVLMLFSGMLVMTAITALHRAIDSADPGYPVRITFNEQIATSQLEDAARRGGVPIVDAEFVQPKEAWEVASEDFLGQDNSLALAKLRIDLERELRRLASTSGLTGTTSRVGLRRLVDELTRRRVLDEGTRSVLDDILPAMNQAIHGGEVSTESAALIVRLGNQVLLLLQAESGIGTQELKPTKGPVTDEH
jgi:hypothetical protein